MKFREHEPLKASVSISYKVSLGNYQSADFWASREYVQDGTTMEAEMARLDGEMLAWLERKGLKAKVS